MAITLIADLTSSSDVAVKNAVDIVAIHDLHGDGVDSWTDPASKVLWLRDLLPERLRHFRALSYSYKAEDFTSPGESSAKSLLSHAHNLVAELCADRQLENAFARPIIFVCHGFGGILAKRALAYSNSRKNKAVAHLRSVYTCTYGILFLGTPHNGMTRDALLSQIHNDDGPNNFMLNLLKGSEMLNETNDQFAPLMKQFSIFNFWEELETQHGTHRFYVVDQDSAAPAWDNVENCGIMATHSTMTKFENRSDGKFRLILEALSRYARSAPAVVRSRWKIDAEYLDRKHQQEAEELLKPQRHFLVRTDSAPPDHNKWCFIPRKPITYFTGRQKHADEVKDMFGPLRQHNDRGGSKIVVIHGLGGSGKTQFCLKYVEDHKHRYWGVFWIDASSEANVESGFAFIGAQAGRGATKASALHWLSQCNQSWLLVLDNADDPDIDISAYYPAKGNGHILITTRNPNAVELSTAGHLHFRGMEPFEAISLLLRAAYPNASHDSEPVDGKKWQLAKGIAIELGYLPLAIVYAGNTIRRNIYTLERYLKYYLPYRKTMLSHSRMRSIDEVNIITTWEIPFQRIVTRESIEHRDAVDLMQIFAFMHHESIPESIFQRSWSSLRSSKCLPKQHPDILPNVWSEESQARYRRAIAVLTDHSIIEYEPSNGSCTMHPVVHDWARSRLTDQDQTRLLRYTMAILAECISPHMEASGRQFRSLLMPHIQSCLQLRKSQHLREPETQQSAAEMEKFASIYAEQGQWLIALELQRRVVEIRMKIMGKWNENTIRSQRNLGQTLWNLFKPEETIKTQKTLLEILFWSRSSLADWTTWPIWRPRHIPYCLALSDITLTLWLIGMRDLSKRAGERAVEVLTARLGPEDPLTLTAMFNLARTYLHLGEEEKSRKLLLWVLKLQKHFFGMDHPDTLMTRNELGMLLCASKRHLQAAQRLVENVLKTRTRILGEEHAYTLWSVNDLSKVLVERGRAEEAVTNLERILPIVKRTLGNDHVGMKLTRSNLGKAYFMAGKWKEAEETIRPLLASIDPKHPDSIHNIFGYAHILIRLGDLKGAEKRCLDILDKITETKMFSLDDPRTLSTAELLLQIYKLQNRKDKIASIKENFPGVDLLKNADRFDPYAVRRGSNQIPKVIEDNPLSPVKSAPQSFPRPPTERPETERPTTEPNLSQFEV